MEMQLSAEAMRFERVSSKESFIVGNWLGKPLLYSPDGIKYFELFRSGIGGGSIHFDDPHAGRDGQLLLAEDTLTWDGKMFKKVACPAVVNVVPLPEVRKPEYLFRLADGRFIYVSADKYQYTYESFRLFIGRPTHMRQVPVLKVDRYRDGGTTRITTPQGVLYVPAPHLRDEKPTWDGDGIERLKLDLYAIKEIGDSVRITKKK